VLDRRVVGDDTEAMGYMRHHAIIVTSFDADLVTQAHAKATGLGMLVTNITRDSVNGYQSFLAAPDGSKEGWDESDAGDARRAEFIDWLDSRRYEDDSTSIDWVEVQYGDDNGDNKVLRHADEHYLKRWADA
jgi:hypothetical protein